jgi:hypothetical protein
LFNLKNDPLEINNLAALPENKTKVEELMVLLDEWHNLTNDTATMNPKTFLPMEYDYKKLKQTPDVHQPEYILKKYFSEVDLTREKSSQH